MTRTALLLLMAAFVTPSEAFAAGLSLESGPVGELAGTVKGLATGFFFVSFVLALLIEGLGTAPGQQRDFAGVIWRAVWILILLGFYGQLFGTVIKTADGVAASLMPTRGYTEFTSKMMDVLFDEVPQAPIANPSGGFWETVKEQASWGAGMWGGVLFNGLTSLLITLSLLAHWVLSQLGRILVAVFYILGPLALVFSLPRGSGTAGKWFSAFVSYAIWPILSALILRLFIAVAFDAIPDVSRGEGLPAGDLLGSLGLALVLAATALTVPSLASSLVGAAAQNFASAGLGQAIGFASTAATLGTSAIGSIRALGGDAPRDALATAMAAAQGAQAQASAGGGAARAASGSVPVVGNAFPQPSAPQRPWEAQSAPAVARSTPAATPASAAVPAQVEAPRSPPAARGAGAVDDGLRGARHRPDAGVARPVSPPAEALRADAAPRPAARGSFDLTSGMETPGASAPGRPTPKKEA